MTHAVIVVDSAAFGGAEAYVAHLAGHLAAGHRCTIVAAEPVPPRLTSVLDGRADCVRVAPVGPRWRRLPGLRRMIRGLRPDVVHVNLIDPRANRVSLAAAVTSGLPAVATAHMIGPTGTGASRALLGALYRRLDAVIAVSDEIAGILVHRLGVDPCRVRVIDNGVPLSEASSRPHRRDGVVRIGAVGRLTRQKGFDILIGAVARLVADGRRVELLVAGEGREADPLRDDAAGLPVRFLGFVDDVPALLATLDVFCLPSRAEGLPLALLEALAAGVPAVSTTVGAIPAAVGDSAVLVAPGDVHALTGALRRLVDAPAVRSDLAVRGRARALEGFTAVGMAHATATVWASVTAGDGRHYRQQG